MARASLKSSYGALDDDVIDDAVESWYGADTIADELADDDTVFVVAVDDGDVVGFAQSHAVEGRTAIGELDWLHVHPDYRGRGIGVDLLRRVETELLDRGADRIKGRVLAANEAGAAFYEEEGFSETAERDVDIGGERFTERVYTKTPADVGDDEVLVEERTTDDGDTVYVAYDESLRATEAPFYATYSDRDRDDRYGYLCGNCDSLDTAMNTMGRVECNDCGNHSKPTRWDAAYL